MADFIFAALDAPVPPPAAGRRHSQFKTDVARTLADLEAELDRVGARNPTLFVDVAASKIRRNGTIDGGFPVIRTPGVRLEFEKRVRGRGDTWTPVRMPCSTFWTAKDNVRAIALTLERLRDVARYGATEQDEQWAGFLRLPGAGGVNTTALALSPERAARIIVDAAPSMAGVHQGVRDAMATTVLRDPLVAGQLAAEARKATHPDAGGAPGAFATVEQAREILARHHGGGRG